MPPVHPDRILKCELAPRDMSANRLALPSGRVTDILNGKRVISPGTALRLGRYFGTDPRLWPNLLMSYELAQAEREIGAKVNAEVTPDAA